jgi:hypothetical protein
LLDPARLQRWKDARARWQERGRAQADDRAVVRIPEGELELLK